jgi:DNA-binding NtrC family response regulator
VEDRKGKFLIIDDVPDMCWALEHILKKNGGLPRRALSGIEARAYIKSERFQLVFLDAKLPDIEGLELARQIREIDSRVPIILVSGYFYKDDVAVQKALEEKLICGFIAKPYSNHEIIAAIKRWQSF